MARIKDRVGDLLDAVVMYVIALWLLFITLPSLDKEKVLPDGRGTLYPSRGTIGSCYQTKDGQHYVRTGSGVRKVGKQLGMQLIARSRRIRNLAIARRIALVSVVVLIATSLAVLAN